MSYVYTCWGNNTVAGVTYGINKTIHITVMICPTKKVELDLSILVSSRLLAMCTIQGNKDKSLQFYGYYYLPLVLQLILALPYGPDHTRFHLLRDNIFNRSTQNHDESIVFDNTLSRAELVRKLYSRKIKPETVATGCAAIPMRLEDVLKRLVYLNHIPSNNNRIHAVLLTVDKQLQVDVSQQTIQAWTALRKIGMHVILASTHVHDMADTGFDRRLIEVIQPMNYINLLPNFKSNAKCSACQFRLNDPILEVKRDIVFDLVCLAGGSVFPGAGPIPKVRFSLPNQKWYTGVHLGVTCTADMSSLYRGQWVTGLTLCLTNQTQIGVLGRNKINVQSLLNACNRVLISDTSDSMTEPTEFSASASFTLNKTDTDSVVVCFQRQGEKQPQVSDQVNYTISKLKVLDAAIHNVKLIIKQPPSSSIRAAQFHCQYTGFVSNLESLLIYSPNATVYHVVARNEIGMSADTNVVDVQINWLEVSPQLSRGKLYCLVQPKGSPIVTERVVSQLPPQNDLIAISAPIAGMSLMTDCPSVPTISVKPDLDARLLVQGSRLEIICEASATSRRLPLKLFYMTTKFSIIICASDENSHEDRTATMVEQEQPCNTVSPDDVACNDTTASNQISNTNYHSTCLKKQQKNGSPPYRQIRLTVTKLRPVDFHARTFCKTLDLYSDATEFTDSGPHLYTPVNTIRFQMPPQIIDFHFNSDSQIWVCDIMAFPNLQSGSIKVLHAYPSWLRKQLDLFSTEKDSDQPGLKHSQLLPDLSQLNSYPYFTRLLFQPFYQIPGGLRRGEAHVRCSLNQVYRDLFTVIATGLVNEEPIMESPEITVSGGVSYQDCEFDTQTRIEQVSIHRQIKTTWLQYDVSLVVLVLMQRVGSKWVQTKEDKQIRSRLFGPWVMTTRSRVNIVPLTSRGARFLLTLPIAPNVEFDTGEYYCSARTTNGTWIIGPLIRHRIVGDLKQMALGYRLFELDKVWRRSLRNVSVGDTILTRCLAWTTRPSERKIIEMSITIGENQTTDKIRINDNANSSTSIIKSIDLYRKVDYEGFLENGECYVFDGVIKQRATLPGPKALCKAPELIWTPERKFYTNADVLICETRGGCKNAQLKWNWAAGPIPQLLAEDDIASSRITSPNSTLALRQVIRGGSYVFRCTAMCDCLNEHIRTAILATIFLSTRDRSDPMEDPINIPGDKDASRLTTLDLKLESRSDDFEKEMENTFSDRVQDTTDGMTDILLSTREDALHRNLEQTEMSISSGYVDSTDILSSSQDGSASFDEVRRYPFSKQQLLAQQRTDDTLYKDSVDELLFKPSVQPQLPMLEVGVSTYSSPSQLSSTDNYELMDDQFLRRPDKFRSEEVLGGRRPQVPPIYSLVEQFREGQDKQTQQITARYIAEGMMEDQSKEVHVLRSKESVLDETLREQMLIYQIQPTQDAVSGRDSKQFPFFSSIPTDIKEADEALERSRRAKRKPDRPVLGEALSDRSMTRERFDSGRAVTPSDKRRLPPTLNFEDLSLAQQRFVDGGRLQRGRLDEEQSPQLQLVEENRTILKRRGLFEDKYATLYDDSLRSDKRSRHELVQPPEKQITSRSFDLDQLSVREMTASPYVSRMKEYDYFTAGHLLSLPWAKSKWLTYATKHRFRWAEVPSGMPVQSSLRDPSLARLSDLVITDRDTQRSRKAWWQMFTSLQMTHTTSSKILTDTEYLWLNARAKQLLKTQLTTWKNDLTELQNNLHDEHYSKTTGTRQSSPQKWSIDEVVLSAYVVIPPAVVTVRCPHLITDIHVGYIPTKVTWIRMPFSDNMNLSELKEELVQFEFSKRNIRMFSTRNGLRSRLYIYPPHKWSDSHTLDITGVEEDDYGFYACITSLASRGSQPSVVNVTKVSSHPLCIMPPISRPNITIDRLENMNETNNEKCYGMGEALVVRCETMSYKMFCELGDKMANGHRIVNTVIRAYVHIKLDTGFYHAIPIDRPILTNDSTNPQAEKLVRTWRLHIEHIHQQAYITCSVRPELIQPAFAYPIYWNLLEQYFESQCQRRLERYSLPITLCIQQFGPLIEIVPNILGTAFLSLNPGQLLTCNSKHYTNVPLRFFIYPLLPSRAQTALKFGVTNITKWLDANRGAVSWFNQTGPSRVRVFIPANETGLFFASCTVYEMNVSENVVLSIASTKRVVTAHLDIWGTCLLACIAAFAGLCKLFKYIKTDRRARARTIYQRDERLNCSRTRRVVD
ncbi:hypothetical protein EG68_06751 [Paragonimus skrjabini miyazakii]|uniref:Ig-like domain-containing protein n=1 Tax=Paragonimus skrjabini miyazakii TaxID=59628 RepID=A0A8S9YNC5_9TREM|nr:hypothetical protein EG68_06751 [Paragonimus skrjabini miyazakii]